jgi:hypothetical protein
MMPSRYLNWMLRDSWSSHSQYKVRFDQAYWSVGLWFYPGVFKLFELPWREFAAEWIDKSSVEGDCMSFFLPFTSGADRTLEADFSFLGRVLEAITTSLNAVPSYVLTLLGVDSTLEPLPLFDGKGVMHSE